MNILSELQKCEPLAPRLRENLDSLGGHCCTTAIHVREKKEEIGKVICHTWNLSLCIFGILFKMRKIIHSFFFM